MGLLGRTQGTRETRNGECAAPGEETGRRVWSEPAVAGPASPRSPPSLRTRVRGGAARTSVPSGRSVGAGPAAGTPGVLWSLRAATAAPEPLWAALRPQPRVSPDGAVTAGRVIGDNRDSVSGAPAWEELWAVGSPVPPFSSEATHFLPSVLNLGGAGSQIYNPPHSSP